MLRDVPGEQCVDAENIECVTDNRRCCFKRQAHSPVFRPQMKPQFVSHILALVRSQTGAAHMPIVSKQEERPVLKAMRALCVNFTGELVTHLIRRERASQVPSHARVAP